MSKTSSLTLKPNEVSALLLETADRLGAAGEKNRFRLVAYKRAAAVVARIAPEDFEDITKEELTAGSLGTKTAEKAITMRDTGTHPFLEDLRAKTTLAARFSRREVEKIVKPVLTKLRRVAPGATIELCGSYRRGRQDLKDGDILVAYDGDTERLVAAFHSCGEAVDAGKKATAIIRQSLQIDLRIVPVESLGAGLLFFTGSASFNIQCRKAAVAENLLLNQYGLFKRAGTPKRAVAGERIAGATEEEVLDALGIGWVDPEERE